MLLKSVRIICALFLFGNIVSCGGGVSEKDVERIIVSAFEATQTLPLSLDQWIIDEFQYQSVVENIKNNDDYTLTQESRFGLDKDNGDISMEVVWKMDGYQEPTSGSEFTGAIAVYFSGNVHDQKDVEDEIEISFDLSIYGDKVDTIAFTMAPDDHRIESPPDLRVNGKPYAFDNDLSFIASVTNTFKSLGL